VEVSLSLLLKRTVMIPESASSPCESSSSPIQRFQEAMACLGVVLVVLGTPFCWWIATMKGICLIGKMYEAIRVMQTPNNYPAFTMCRVKKDRRTVSL
jgi:hypothetical protein